MSSASTPSKKTAFNTYVQIVLDQTRKKVEWIKADHASEGYRRLQDEIRKFDPEMLRLGDAIDAATVEASEKLIRYLSQRTEN